MIAALTCWSKMGLDRESELALAPSMSTPTAASLRPWDTRIAIKRSPSGGVFGCRPGASSRLGLGPASESLPDLSRSIVSARMAEIGAFRPLDTAGRNGEVCPIALKNSIEAVFDA
jgi:hypothetical protein